MFLFNRFKKLSFFGWVTFLIISPFICVTIAKATKIYWNMFWYGFDHSMEQKKWAEKMNEKCINDTSLEGLLKKDENSKSNPCKIAKSIIEQYQLLLTLGFILDRHPNCIIMECNEIKDSIYDIKLYLFAFIAFLGYKIVIIIVNYLDAMLAFGLQFIIKKNKDRKLRIESKKTGLPVSFLIKTNNINGKSRLKRSNSVGRFEEIKESGEGGEDKENKFTKETMNKQD